MHDLLGDGECTETAGRTALETLMGRLATAAGVEASVLRLHILKSTAVNAFVLPGGHIVVMDGLIQAAEEPDDLAGVLAHEMAHIAHRHTVRQMVRHMGLGLIVDTATGGMGGEIGRLLLTLSYSRDDEREADRGGGGKS
ncbi:MAG: peptidase M48 family protein [Rhodospirillaceae bacterium]|nr:MAG: peptidase M48 family protein [Rhodospirillaceae bacterium]